MRRVAVAATRTASLVAQREHAVAFRSSLGTGMQPPHSSESEKAEHRRLGAWVGTVQAEQHYLRFT